MARCPPNPQAATRPMTDTVSSVAAELTWEDAVSFLKAKALLRSEAKPNNSQSHHQCPKPPH